MLLSSSQFAFADVVALQSKGTAAHEDRLTALLCCVASNMAQPLSELPCISIFSILRCNKCQCSLKRLSVVPDILLRLQHLLLQGVRCAGS